MSRFGIQQFSLNGTAYPGAKGYTIDRGVEVRSEGSDGTVYETAHHVMRRRPTAEITTLSLKTIISALADTTDFPNLALNGSTGLVMYGARQIANQVGYSASSVHETRTGLNGVIYLAGIRWSLGQPAEAMLKALFKSTDGETQALSESSAAALLTAPVPDFGFGLYTLTLNGSTIVAVDSLEVAIDPRFDFDYSRGLPEPTSIIGAGSNGKLSITLKAELGDIDLGAGTGSCVVVFKRYAIGGGFGTDTVTLTFNAAWSIEENLGGENGRTMRKGLLVRTRFASSTKPLTIAVA
jgi:hypothetical protein